MSRPDSTSPRTVAVVVLAALFMTAPCASVLADGLSEHGSVHLSAVGVVSSVGLGVEMLSSVPHLSVTAVEVSAEGTVWLLSGIAEGSGEAIELSVEVAGGASMAVGTSVEVVTSAAGSLLVASGEALAFIPNELGAALYYSQTWDEAKGKRP